jgi:type IV secretory pathway VirB4 component
MPRPLAALLDRVLPAEKRRDLIDASFPMRRPDPARARTGLPKAIRPVVDFDTLAEGLADRLVWNLKVNPTSILNHDGAFTRSFRIRAKRDLSWAPRSEKNRVADLINNAFRELQDGWMIHARLMRTPITHYPHAEYGDMASWLVHEERRIAFESGAHYRSDIVWTLTYLPPADAAAKLDASLTTAVRSSRKKAKRARKQQSTAAMTRLQAEKTFEEGVARVLKLLEEHFETEALGLNLRHDANGHPYVADDQIGLYLRGLAGRTDPVRATRPGAVISEYLAQDLTRLEGGVLRIGESLVKPITVIDIPDDTSPDLLDALEQIPGRFDVVHRWIGRDPEKARAEMRSLRGRALSKRSSLTDQLAENSTALEDPEAYKSANDATQAFGESSSRVVSFGYYTLTVIAYEPIIAGRMREAYDRIQELSATIVGRLTSDGFNVATDYGYELETLLGSLEGHGRENLCRGMLSTRNLANLVPTTTLWTGDWTAPDVENFGANQPPLAVFSGIGATPCAVNLHVGKRGGHTLLVGETGSGKALDLETPILTPRGWKRMGDIRAGEAVVGRDGTPTTVVGVFPQGKKDAFRVTFSDGTSLVACAEHLWAVRTRLQKWRGRDYKVMSTGDIIEHMRAGREPLYIPMVEPVEFTDKALPIDPYVLGALLGDGTLYSSSARFTSADNEIVEEIATLLPTGTDVYCYRGTDYRFKATVRRDVRQQRGVYELPIQQKNSLTVALGNLGLLGKKSYEKAIPDAYLFASVEQRLRLLQGLFNTDGSPSGASCDYTTTSAHLASQVRFLVESLGGTVRLKKRRTTYVYKGERRDGRTSYRLRASLRSGLQLFSLQRKRDALNERTVYQPTRAIVSVEPVGVRDMQCIAVDAADHLYVADHCIVTHNTTLAGFLISEHRKYRGSQQVIIDNGYQHWVHAKAIGVDAAHRVLTPTATIGLSPFAGSDVEGIPTRAKLAAMMIRDQGGDPREFGEEVYVGLVYLAQGPAERQRVSGLMEAPGISKKLRDILRQYSKSGPAGNLFDNPPSEYTTRMTVFEVSGIPESMYTLALSTLEVEIDRICVLSRPTMIVSEEFWDLLRNPIGAAIFEEGLRTKRRMGGHYLLFTQNINDIDESPIAKIVIGSCVTKIILPNENANGDYAKRFEQLGLASWERQALAEYAGKPVAYFVQPHGRRLVSTKLGPVALAKVSQSSEKAIEIAEKILEQFGPEDFFPELVYTICEPQKSEKRAAIAESWRRHAYYFPRRNDRSDDVVAAPAHDRPHPTDPFGEYVEAHAVAAVS